MNSKPIPDHEIHLTRVYDAPLQAVWEAWTDPKQVVEWWGPRGFSTTTESHEIRPGGSWIFVMKGPEGQDYPNATLYQEVIPYKRLVYDHGAKKGEPPMFRVTVEFQETAGQTSMHMIMALPSAELAAATRGFVKQANGETTWDRLSEYLAKKLKGREIFSISRSFEAPPSQVYQMWTQAEHVVQWTAPTGASMEFLSVDIRPGGKGMYRMMMGPMTLYGCSHYLTLEKPHRLVYTQNFCDEKGQMSRHPMAPTWPETMQTTVVFVEEPGGKTRLTLSWEPTAGTKADELAVFVGARMSMTGGWTGSFDKLEAYLAKQALSL